jgi:hypothetical protein
MLHLRVHYGPSRTVRPSYAKETPMKSDISPLRELEARARESCDQYIFDLAKLAFENHDQAALQELKQLLDWETDARNHWRMR